MAKLKTMIDVVNKERNKIIGYGPKDFDEHPDSLRFGD